MLANATIHIFSGTFSRKLRHMTGKSCRAVLESVRKNFLRDPYLFYLGWQLSTCGWVYAFDVSLIDYA